MAQVANPKMWWTLTRCPYHRWQVANLRLHSIIILLC